MNDTAVRIIFVNTGSEDEAATIAHALVTERLAACGNILPRVRSIYRWQGKIEDEPEVMLLIKTTEDRIPTLIDRVNQLHSYDVPEIIALPITQGSESYLNWVIQNTSEP